VSIHQPSTKATSTKEYPDVYTAYKHTTHTNYIVKSQRPHFIKNNHINILI